jgi:uncharacterized protein YjdB
MMKRVFSIALGSLALLCSFMFLQNCQFWGELDNPLDKKGSFVHVAGVDLNPATVDLEVGDTYQLAATISPGDADNKQLAWTAVNPSVATVSAGGLVTAAALGTTTVTATSADGGKTDSCAVKVMVKVPVDGVALNKDATAIAVGATEQLIPVITPLDAYNQKVTWTSSDDTFATVSADGTVRVLKTGPATITVTTVDGGKTDSCLVTGIDPIHPTGVSVAPKTATVKVGATQQLTTAVSPSDATNKSVTWTSNYPAIASVNSYGLVYGLSIGTAVITATTVDGSLTDTCVVTVPEIAVTGVSLNKTTAEILVGSTNQLTATVAPADATTKAVEWTSDKEAVVTVSSSGLVTAHSVGSATITVRTLSGGKTATCAVTTIQPVPVTGVSLNASEYSMLRGDTYQLSATIAPANATTTGVEWTSSDSTVATVSSTGLVSSVGLGSARITATTIDGRKTAHCDISVVFSKPTTVYFSDDFENGLGNWTVSGSDWAITNSNPREGNSSASDSPDGDYLSNANSILATKSSIDLRGSSSPVLSYWHKISLNWTSDYPFSDKNIDYCYTEISQDGGVSWTVLKQYDRTQNTTWGYQAIDLKSYIGKQVKVRFRLRDNSESGTADGWTIDTIEIRENDTERLSYPLADDFENGCTNWDLANGNEWSIFDSTSRSTSHSISESPNGNYPSHAYSQLIMEHPIDLVGTSMPALKFWYKLIATWTSDYPFSDKDVDWADVEVSIDGGITWAALRSYNHMNITTWTEETISLIDYVDKSVLIKFTLCDVGGGTADGWAIDDLVIGEL